MQLILSVFARCEVSGIQLDENALGFNKLSTLSYMISPSPQALNFPDEEGSFVFQNCGLVC